MDHEQRQKQIQKPSVGYAAYSWAIDNPEFIESLANAVSLARTDGKAQVLLSVGLLRDEEEIENETGGISNCLRLVLSSLQVEGESLSFDLVIVDAAQQVLRLAITSKSGPIEI